MSLLAGGKEVMTSTELITCGSEKKEGTYKTLDEYLASMKKQNEELRNKNGTAKPDEEFVADLIWISTNRKLYNYAGSFNNVSDAR